MAHDHDDDFDQGNVFKVAVIIFACVFGVAMLGLLLNLQ